MTFSDSRRESVRKRANRYSEFRQATRRHSPSELIPFIAAMAAPQMYEADMKKWAHGIAPWVYAAMARDCLLHSDEFRHKTVDEKEVIRMRNLLTNAHDPYDGAPGIFEAISGYVYEQGVYQRTEKFEMARSFLLYTQTDVQPHHETPSARDWEDHLGLPLQKAITAAFMLGALTADNDGAFDPALLSASRYGSMESMMPAADLHRVLDLLTTTVPAAKARAAEVPPLPPERQRYAFNPLVERPFVTFHDDVRYAPQPKFISSAFSVENLYYRGIQKFPKFGPSFGGRVEAYTGMQLKQSGEHWCCPSLSGTSPASALCAHPTGS